MEVKFEIFYLSFVNCTNEKENDPILTKFIEVEIFNTFAF